MRPRCSREEWRTKSHLNDTLAIGGRGGVELQSLQGTTQLIRRVRLCHDRDTLRIPVELAEIFHRPRCVGNPRTGSMQSDDAGVRGGDLDVTDRETSEDNSRVDIGRMETVFEVDDIVGTGYDLALGILSMHR